MKNGNLGGKKMETCVAIKTRRSIRQYRGEKILKEIINELLQTAIWAPSGMNKQPWGFVVIEDEEYLQKLSSQTKSILLERFKNNPEMEKYMDYFADPKTSIFYHAPVLVLIYGKKDVFTVINDCSMVAQNLMLAAWEYGIGSCWIGFVYDVLNTKEVKSDLGVPDSYGLVASVILGYPDGSVPISNRNNPIIFSWKK